ncbi:MAG: endonuclease/exonuclease/phosphatase family protein [Rhodospirillum sp.]|nr:endonuclease/exonuclease/phosphatase family protein [Rhodospirillum sp.]MCF8487562.1 endonuclease/exonuclease/phosphatase family protein [Rhodospirillum sp.]MCF8499045.1 endonuclease/exonuclease/phosphatase family protein [Rhodospirillum sp.]
MPNGDSTRTTPPLSLRVVCWNLHGCVGTDGRRDVARVARALAALKPDIAGLQEVDLSRLPNPPHDPLEVLANGTDMRAVHAPTLWRGGHAYGNAVLSRWPMSATLPLDLSVPDKEPRNAMDVTLEHPAGRPRVLITHLGLGRKERRIQVAHLAERLAQPLGGTDGDDGAHPMILMGDLNEWLPWGRTSVASLKSRFGADFSRRTFPSFLPLFRLDRMLFRPSPRTVIRVADPPRGFEVRRASDHLPLVVDLEFD